MNCPTEIEGPDKSPQIPHKQDLGLHTEESKIEGPKKSRIKIRGFQCEENKEEDRKEDEDIAERKGNKKKRKAEDTDGVCEEKLINTQKNIYKTP